MQFFSLDSSIFEASETYFFGIVTTHYDHPRYVKHVLGCIYVFFTLFGYLVRGGGGGASKGMLPNLLMSNGIGTQPAYAVFQRLQLKNQSFRNLFF